MTQLAKTTENLMAEWQAVAPQPLNQTNFNKISIDNSETIDVEGETKINENFGCFFAEKDGIKTNIDITKAEFFPAVQRTQVKAPYDNATKTSEYFCREVDDLSLIKVIRTADKEVVAEGSFFDLREKYQLRTKEVLYVFYEGDYYRWVLTAGGWQNVKVLTEMIRKAAAPILFRISKIEKQRSSDGKAFNSVDFELVQKMTEAEDIKEAIEHVKNVKKFLGDYYDEIEKEKSEAEKSFDKQAGEPMKEIDKLFPKIDYESKIKPADLPF